MKPAQLAREISGIAVAEEAVELVRHAGLPALALYYVGAMPFVLAALAFWSMTAQLPDVEALGVLFALVLAVLFVWMKVWQSRYSQRLLAALHGAPLERRGFRAAFRSCSIQALVHASGWVVLPFALLLLLPVAWVYAFYQNCTVLDDGQYRRARDLARDAARLSTPWPRQNLLIIWLLSPLPLFILCTAYFSLLPVLETLEFPVLSTVFSLYTGILFIIVLPLSPFAIVVALNIAAGIAFGAALLSVLFGVETVLSVVPGATMTPTFVCIVCGLAYLALDPLLKAAFVVRCFYCTSRHSGEDLLLALKRGPRLGLMAILLFAGGIAVSARAYGENAVSAESLEQSIQSELQDARYAWRDPDLPQFSETSPLLRAFRSLAETIQNALGRVRDWIDDFFDWLFGRAEESAAASRPWGPLDLRGFLRVLLVILSVGLLFLTVVFLVRLWAQHRRQAQPAVTAAPVAVPDAADERTTADKLPEEGWLALAREYMGRGELRLAMRCLFLATLARLAQQGLIHIGHAKTNADYRREMQRRAHALPQLLPVFARSVSVYEQVWYGDHPANEDGIHELEQNQQELTVQT